MTAVPQPPPPPIEPLSHSRGNPGALGISLAWALVCSILLDVVVPGWFPGSSSYQYGEALGAALMPALVVWLVARASSKDWPVWRCGLIIIAAAFALSGLQSAFRHLNDARAVAAAGPRVTVSLPQQVIGLHQVTSADARQREQAALASMSGRDVGGDFVAALYGPRADGSAGYTLAIVGINAKPMSQMDVQSARDTSKSLDDVAAGEGLTQGQRFPFGEGSGAMECGYTRVGETCIWVGPGRAGTIFFVRSAPLAAAADQTRRIRLAVERRQG